MVHLGCTYGNLDLEVKFGVPGRCQVEVPMACYMCNMKAQERIGTSRWMLCESIKANGAPQIYPT